MLFFGYNYIFTEGSERSYSLTLMDEVKSMCKVPEMFGALVFNDDIMRARLPKEIYKSLKKKWKVSIQAMMYRTRQIGIISANQFQYMMRIVSKNGWRTKEPGDVPGQLKDTIFQGAIDLLFDGGYLSRNELVREFAQNGVILAQDDLENLMCLRKGTLDQEAKVVPFLTIKH